MNKDKSVETLTLEEVEQFLIAKISERATHVAQVGAGAWSRCFGFQVGADELVIRFGKHGSDFEKDKQAFHFAAPDLPIPEVSEFEPYLDGFYAVSTYMPGKPLEAATADEWPLIIPSLVAALEAMRTADLSSFSGFGDWGLDGIGKSETWSQHLLGASEEPEDSRLEAWRPKLKAMSSECNELFDWGVERIQEVAIDGIPRSLLHCDLINRNVHVIDGKVSGLFDWGCSRYGDHLYDIAWFDFWEPWYPNLDLSLLHNALEQQWQQIGYVVADREARLQTCYLHIGIDHLAYNAIVGDMQNLLATAERMRTLVPSLRTQ